MSLPKLEATFSVNTPLFMAGNNQASAELRYSGIKAELAFWWRSLAWQIYDGEIKDIQAAERAIFGSTSNQAIFRPKLTHGALDIIHGRPKGTNVLSYESNDSPDKAGMTYLGYGVLDFKAQLQRTCILPFTFHLTLTFKPKTTPSQFQQVMSALVNMGMYGGLGARKRRGFGSVDASVARKDVW